MDEFTGIPSLFIASLEFLLLINAIIFGQKNKVNIIVFIIISIYAVNHLFEFVFCQFAINHNALIIANFSLISFLPPLSLLLVLIFWHHETALKYLIFLPTLVFLYFFLTKSFDFLILDYYYFYVSYSYPLRTELGTYYFVMNVAALLIIGVKAREPKLRYKRHINLVLIVTMTIAVIFPFLILMLFPSLNRFAESILSKFAFFYVLGLTYFSLKNKIEYLSEKG